MLVYTHTHTHTHTHTQEAMLPHGRDCRDAPTSSPGAPNASKTWRNKEAIHPQSLRKELDFDPVIVTLKLWPSRL